MIRHELKWQNLLSKIILVGHWHIRTANEQNFSIIRDLFPYQQRVLLKEIHIPFIIGQLLVFCKQSALAEEQVILDSS
jgi:hypothetical protein